MARNVRPDAPALDDALEGEVIVRKEGESLEPQIMEASDVIHMLAPEAPAPSHHRKPEPKAKHYRVISGPPTVMYNGGQVRITPNKVWREGSVDIALLERQGVRFAIEEE